MSNDLNPWPIFTRRATPIGNTNQSLEATVKNILQARIYDLAIETPLEKMNGLSSKTQHHLYLKREDLQPVFSFKPAVNASSTPRP